MKRSSRQRIIGTVAFLGVIIFAILYYPPRFIEKVDQFRPPNKNASDIIYVGPRENIPKDAPEKKGMRLFSMPAEGVLSRSGQPSVDQFQWLKNHGWKSVVDLRVVGEHNENNQDSQLQEFPKFGFNYINLSIKDGTPPSDEQALQFLSFITDENNQPSHVHCRGGIGRAGTMTALYRYSVQGWPIDKAIEESRLYEKGISKSQKQWLLDWAAKNAPGSFSKSSQK